METADNIFVSLLLYWIDFKNNLNIFWIRFTPDDPICGKSYSK